MDKERLGVVLLHGAGTGAWVWDRVRRELEEPTIAVDLPLDEAGTTPAKCVARILRELDNHEIGRVVAVLHSWAGVLGGELQHALSGRLAHVVYLSAVVPHGGGSFVDALPVPQRWILKLLLRRNPNGLRPSDQMIRHEYCNDLTPADSCLVIDRFQVQRPEPFLIGTRPYRATGAETYITLGQDQSVSPALQKKNIKRVGTPEVVSIEAGHLAMLSRPVAVAASIRDAVSRS